MTPSAGHPPPFVSSKSFTFAWAPASAQLSVKVHIIDAEAVRQVPVAELHHWPAGQPMELAGVHAGVGHRFAGAQTFVAGSFSKGVQHPLAHPAPDEHSAAQTLAIPLVGSCTQVVPGQQEAAEQDELAGTHAGGASGAEGATSGTGGLASTGGGLASASMGNNPLS
jgi:hypothetical protein